MYDASVRDIAVGHVVSGRFGLQGACSAVTASSGRRPSERSVQRWCSRFKQTGSVKPRPQPSKFHAKWSFSQLKKMSKMIDDGAEQITHEGIADLAYVHFQNEIAAGGQTTRLLKFLKRTRKRVQLEHPNKDWRKVDQFLVHMQECGYTVDQLAVLDESYINKDTLNLVYGYSRQGTKCRSKSAQVHVKRRAIIGCICTEGMVGSVGIYHAGSTNKEVFEHYLKTKCLPGMTAFPGPRSVLVMDNAAYHDLAEIRRICAPYGVIVEALPPYSPEWSPIELLWKSVKARVRRERSRLSRESGFGRRLARIVHTRAHARNCSAWFSACGYYDLLS